MRGLVFRHIKGECLALIAHASVPANKLVERVRRNIEILYPEITDEEWTRGVENAVLALKLERRIKDEDVAHDLGPVSR